MWPNHQDAILGTRGQMLLAVFERLPLDACEDLRQRWEALDGPSIREMLSPDYAMPPDGLLIDIRDAADVADLLELVG